MTAPVSSSTSLDSGVSLVETLVATLLMLIVSGAVLQVVSPRLHSAHVQPVQADAQQRSRVGAGALLRDIGSSGAGADSGPFAGTLARFVASVIPRRLGLAGSDPSTVVRSDAITVLSVRGAHSTLAAPFGPGDRLVPLDAPSCRPGPACGFRPGTTLIVFDRAGDFDLLAVAAVDATGVSVRALQAAFAKRYAAGALVGEASPVSYWLDPAGQLRYGDVDQVNVPVIDEIVELAFTYYGDPRPPREPRPPVGEANCLYDAAGNPLPGLTVLGAGNHELVELPASMFGDGPWCGSGDNLYDADLLRIRQVRVVLSVQAASDELRGSGPTFSKPGTARHAHRMLPDYRTRFAVSPRNLGVLW